MPFYPSYFVFQDLVTMRTNDNSNGNERVFLCLLGNNGGTSTGPGPKVPRQ